MERAIREYAKKILKKHGCTSSAYWGEDGERVIEDLKEAYPDGMEYPYVDVANAILLLAKPNLIKRYPYMMAWDNDNACDGCQCESFGEAKNNALDTLLEWEMQQIQEYKNIKGPGDFPAALTQEQREDWDYMIYNCSTRVKKYNPMTDEYETCWEPSAEDLRSVGWITIDEMEGGR